jgi:cystathionine beta-lyase
MDFDTPIDRSATASFKWDLYGPDALPLWVADMDFASPPPVIAALEARARHGVFGYSLVPDSMYEALGAHLTDRYGWRVERDWIVWLPSVVPGVSLACRAFAGPGEAVMLITPAYPPFLEELPAQGVRLVTVPSVRADAAALEGGSAATAGATSPWSLPLDEMEAALTPDTRVVVLCHPHNPLGRVWRRDELAAVAGFCRRHDLVLCSDEIHCGLILDDLAHVPAATLSDDAAARTVTLMSPSKTFNLPGLNFAFAVIPDADLRRRYLAAAEGLLPFPGCFALAAAEAAYRDGGPWLEELLDYLRGNRDLVERFVAEELAPMTTTHVEATYLAWLDARGIGFADPARAFREAGVALSDGVDFGAPGWLRLNFACPRSTLDEALARMKKAVEGRSR